MKRGLLVTEDKNNRSNLERQKYEDKIVIIGNKIYNKSKEVSKNTNVKIYLLFIALFAFFILLSSHFDSVSNQYFFTEKNHFNHVMYIKYLVYHYVANAAILLTIIGFITTKVFCYSSRKKLVMQIDKYGIIVTGNIKWIPWSAIESICELEIHEQKYIGITVFEIEKLKEKVTEAERRSFEENLAADRPPILIYMGYDGVVSKVATLLSERLEEWRAEKVPK